MSESIEQLVSLAILLFFITIFIVVSIFLMIIIFLGGQIV